jgi:hypothetical protein
MFQPWCSVAIQVETHSIGKFVKQDITFRGARVIYQAPSSFETRRFRALGQDLYSTCNPPRLGHTHDEHGGANPRRQAALPAPRAGAASTQRLILGAGRGIGRAV